MFQLRHVSLAISCLAVSAGCVPPTVAERDAARAEAEVQRARAEAAEAELAKLKAPQPPRSDLSAERRAAEALQKLGAGFRIRPTTGSDEVEVSKVAPLPATPFYITHLELCANPQVTNEALMSLEWLTEVTSVNVYHNPELNCDFAFLKRYAKLRYLDANLSGVTDAALANVKRLTSLHVLKIAGPQVTDAGLEQLSGLTELRELALPFTKISDAGLEHLKGLKNLETLYLQETKVTAAGVAAFKAALPNCNVATEGQY